MNDASSDTKRLGAEVRSQIHYMDGGQRSGWSNAININDDNYTLNVWASINNDRRGKFYAQNAVRGVMRGVTKEAVNQMTEDEVKAYVNQLNMALADNPYTAGMSVTIYKQMAVRHAQDNLSGVSENNDVQVGWKFGLNDKTVWTNNNFSYISSKGFSADQATQYLSARSFVFQKVTSNWMVAQVKNVNFVLDDGITGEKITEITFNLEVGFPINVNYPQKARFTPAVAANLSAIAANMTAVEMMYSDAVMTGPLVPNEFAALMQAQMKAFVWGVRVKSKFDQPGVVPFPAQYDYVIIPK